MTRQPLILILVIIALLLCAARPLICWSIGWDLQFHRVPCWSSEFDTDPIYLPPEPTATPTAYIAPTATIDWPLDTPTSPTRTPWPYYEPTQVPLETAMPYPIEPYPWE